MMEIKGKYIPGNVYNNMRETFIKNWKSKILLGLDLSEDIPNLNNHDISERKMICEICIRELLHDMNKKIDLLKELHFLVMALKKVDKGPGEEIFDVCKKPLKN